MRCSLGVAALLCMIGTCISQSNQDTLNYDLLSEKLPGVKVLYSGPQYQSFQRPLPGIIETTLFHKFEGFFNSTQEFYGTGPNTYEAEGRQFVVSIKNGRVTGALGTVYDSQGQMFAEFAPSAADSAVAEQEINTADCKHFKKLATSIQKYGQMYYHFLQEVLPRIILLQPFLGPETKLLIFGSPYELNWLAQLGIPSEQIEVYDPAVQYCAEELLVPTMSPVITPPKENYQMLRTAFNAEEVLPESERDLIIYCSRAKATDRQVANEPDILAAIQQQYPSATLYIYTGDESVADTIQLFRQAAVVVGMHGAGLSHISFSAPGTAVVEFLFMFDPPMMFWHASAALELRYVMVPLAQSWWLDQHVTVPVQDVMDALALAMGSSGGQCLPGFVMDTQTHECMACPAGSYRPAGANSCLPCGSGKYASGEGSGFCSTCPVGSYSEAGRSCVLCPPGTTTMFPGAASDFKCILEEDVEARMELMFDQRTLVKKLVSFPAWQTTKAKTTLEWISAMLSPRRLLHQWHQEQLQPQYLRQLFNSDSSQNAASREPLLEDVVIQRDDNLEPQGNYHHRRQLLAYIGSSTQSQGVYHHSRSLLLQNGYGAQALAGARRRLQSYAAQPHGGYRRRLLSYAAQPHGGYRRSLLSYQRGGYNAGRTLMQGVMSSWERLKQAARRVLQS